MIKPTSRVIANPVSIVFQYGKPPFTSSILLKQHSHKTSLSECLKIEKQEQASGGYIKEISEKSYKIRPNIQAHEFIRKSKYGDSHQIIISTSKKNNLIELWYMSSQAVKK